MKKHKHKINFRDIVTIIFGIGIIGLLSLLVLLSIPSYDIPLTNIHCNVSTSGLHYLIRGYC